MGEINVKSPRVLSDLTENTTTNDEDIMIVGNDGGNNIHRITFGNIVSALKNKFLNWVFDDLSTTDKTVVGAINELNTNIKHGQINISVSTESIGEVEITFDSPFANVPTVVTSFYSATQNPYFGEATVMVDNVSTTGFKARVAYYGSGGISPGIVWVAIGI